MGYMGAIRWCGKSAGLFLPAIVPNRCWIRAQMPS